MKTATGLLYVLLLTVAIGHPAFAQVNADTILLNGKIVTLDAATPAAEALAVRDGKIMAVGKIGRHPQARRQRHAHRRSRRPHRHSGADRFPHACHPRGDVLRHRGELDRRRRSIPDAMARIKRDGATRQARPMDHRRRRLDAAAVRREAPPDPGRACRRRARQSGLHPVVLQRRAAQPGGPRDARHRPRTRTCRRAARSSATQTAIRPAGFPATTRRSRRLFDKLPLPTFDAEASTGTKQFFRELNRLGLTGVTDPAAST